MRAGKGRPRTETARAAPGSGNQYLVNSSMQRLNVRLRALKRKSIPLDSLVRLDKISSSKRVKTYPLHKNGCDKICTGVRLGIRAKTCQIEVCTIHIAHFRRFWGIERNTNVATRASARSQRVHLSGPFLRASFGPNIGVFSPYSVNPCSDCLHVRA